MEAPDKIYLVRDAVNPEGIFDSVASKNPMFYDDIAYIRKDAILEWAEKHTASFEEQMENKKPTDTVHRVISGGLSTIELLIEYINSL